MAVDTNFSTFFDKLKLLEDDPLILPPKTWESIPSQNAPTSSSYFPPQPPPPLHYSPSPSLSEGSLVRLALNALQGLESALISIEKLSAVFISDPADRTYHTIPNLWNRSTSTHALGKFLTSIARSGFVIFLLRKFVDYFNNFDFDAHLDAASSFSLLNQAFGVAVGKVLEGYMSALCTLNASIDLRRSSKSNGVDLENCRVSCFTSVVHSEVTLLEVYLHTNELRTQVEVLGNVCNVQSVALCFLDSSVEELTAKANLEFCNFYRGGDLLTYLYRQLQVADPSHKALLKFLFIRSCEPYIGFIRSWIYEAEISDPYKEFMVEYADNLSPHPHYKGGIPIDFLLASIQDRVAVPCFLKDFVIPIVRAGQQLQVIKKLFELCNYVGPEDYTLKDILKTWHRQVVPHDTISIAFDNGEGSSKNAVSCVLFDRADDNTNFDDSSTSDELYVWGTSDSSECSSLSGSEEQAEAEQLIEQGNGLVGDEQRYLSSLSFFMSSPSDTALQKPTQSEISRDIEIDSRKNYEENNFVGHFITAYRPSLPCFDFSTVEDPCKASVEKFSSSFQHEFGSPVPLHITAPATSGKSHDEGKQGFDGEAVLFDNARACVSDLSVHLKEQDKEAVVSTNGCGGTSWQSQLKRFSYTENESVGDHRESLSSTFEIPLDFVIDKCLLQEILLQYKYVSRLAIKLLEEGFDLHGHLQALRRYYFMESADWADLFIVSLWHHKWCVVEAEQRVLEIQRFLELSVKRSSCERDPNKDRLFVYIKGNDTMPLSAFTIGVHSFNFLGLGYRVDWPVSIVLTPSGLKIYAEIFSFLIHVKLAVFSLTEVWRTMKDMMHMVTRNHHSATQEREICHFNMLIKMRHHVNHFISALQQYVQSQLSYVSWCKFLHSLKFKVKDMMDLESVHMAYLTDSLHICFLSNETQSVANIIESILQCAFEFRSCFTGGMWDMGLDQGDLCKLSRINISQVLAIKQKFDKNLKQLHLCYLKSPKHGEFGLSRFWGYLNYNKYYSDVGNEMDLYAL
ncbi:GAMMA-TUBULIN COMPLEX COMPONENT 5 [Salix koriyanagi]|uniref:Gamma-tubulin complex component n=1 Tax=Salix koriyanagi TaxID=2511006 RepID=A0A9Q0TSP2_9ROSI|nr:GAMMA-TUBULIN COMPLEX COMPONENT 5 [Salix koriyanagi]